MIPFLILQVLDLHRGEDDSGNHGDPLISRTMHGVFMARGDLHGARAVTRVRGGEQEIAADVVLRAAEFVIHPVQASQQNGLFRATKVQTGKKHNWNADEEKLHGL